MKNEDVLNRRLRKRTQPFVKVWDLPTMQIVLVILDKETPSPSADPQKEADQVPSPPDGVLR